MFILQKIISRLLFPVPLFLIILGLSFFLTCRSFVRQSSQWRRIGFTLFAAACILFIAAATAPVSDALLWRLERRYEPLSSVPPDVECLVVLGSGHAEHDSIGVWQRLGRSARARVIDGVRLAQGNRVRVLFSGYEGGGTVSSAETGRKAAVELGLEPERTEVFPDPRNTAEEARAIADYRSSSDACSGPILLVTSASHMPRAVYLFEQADVPVIPAPTDYRAIPGGYTAWSLIPSASALDNTRRAWYEMLGLAWAMIT